MAQAKSDHNTTPSNVIAFRRPEAPEAAPVDLPALWNPSSPTKPPTAAGSNARLRKLRRDAWSLGLARVAYYRAALDMISAIEIAKLRGLREARHHKGQDYASNRQIVVQQWRDAIGAQLLTPASRLSDVEWKRTILRGKKHFWTGVSLERAEQAIQQDLDFLASHPVKNCAVQA